MQGTIGAIAAAGALLFGGAAINPPAPHAVPAPRTTVADAHTYDHHIDRTRLWGLAGLAGCAALTGLTRQRVAASGGGKHRRTGSSRPGPDGLRYSPGTGFA